MSSFDYPIIGSEGQDDSDDDPYYIPPDETEFVEDDADGAAAEQPTATEEDGGPFEGVLTRAMIADVLRSGTTRVPFEVLRSFVQRSWDQLPPTMSMNHTDPDEEPEEERSTVGRSPATKWFPVVTEPQEVGDELLRGGEFGRLGPYLQARESPYVSLAKRFRDLRARQGYFVREDLSRPIIPNTSGTIVARYNANPYCGQYSTDSSFYYTCVQDFRLHIYDTSQPPSFEIAASSCEDQTTMKETKTINAVQGNWTITDSHLSPDNERMIYSSITTTVHMTKTREPSGEQIPIPLADGPRRGTRGWHYSYADNFGIYSCRFSADGNEIVAGGSGSIYVYDLQGMRTTVRIVAHEDDVNSCCWADRGSGNVLISASDDTFLKVWDRRSLGTHAKPAGVLVGHTEGIAYVSPKGDGRYVVSNGKDQTMRLWDLRKMHSHSEWEALPQRHYGLSQNWDYRNGPYRKPRFDCHPKNCSVMAYRGHTVLKTLIRCHFSPDETTGGSYLYTGSADGRIHIYSLDGRIVQVLDRAKALPISYDPSEPEPSLSTRMSIRARGSRYMAHNTRLGVVRDVSWHSREPVLMSVAWGDGYEGGNVAKHEWKGLGKNGMTLEDVVQQQRENYETRGAILPAQEPRHGSPG